MKLFYKLFCYLMIGILIIISIEGWLNYRIEIDQFDEDMKRNATQIGKLMSGLIEHTWEKSGEEKTIQLIKDANSSEHHIKIRWVWLEKTQDSEHLPVIGPKELGRVIKGDILSVKINNNGGPTLRYTYLPLNLSHHEASAIELAQSLKPLTRFSGKMMIRSFKIAGMIMLISGVILYWYIKLQIHRRLVILSAKAKRIGQGDIQPDLQLDGNDELTELAEIVNEMCSQLIAGRDNLRRVHKARIKTLEQLQHTDRLSTVGEVSAGIAHELGTPLNIVSGRAKMIARDDMANDEIRENAEIIRNQSDRMTTTIRQLLDFSRREKLRFASTNINSLVIQVFDILSPLAKKQNVTLALADISESQVLYIDPNQIQQVLVNLVMNSIHAMPNGGATEVAIFRQTMCSPNTGEESLYLGLSVSDTGTGIDDDTMQHIFEPFFTTKKTGEGTGLGLSIIQGIIEEHNGWINVESQAGSGAIFTFYLPTETDE